MKSPLHHLFPVLTDVASSANQTV